MTDKEILEGNKLIALFMEAWFNPDCLFNDIKGTWFIDGIGKRCADGCLKFHTSWDWIMPVVEKIEKLGNGNRYELVNFQIVRNFSCVSVANVGENLYGLDKNIICLTKIESVYYSVIEFIKWYNQQNKDLPKKS